MSCRALCALACFALVAVVAATSAAAATSPAARAADRNCDDFSNQAAAQSYFISRGGPGSDPDRLDADNDGVACQDLPCPCSSRKGRKGTKKSGGRRNAAPRKRAQVIRARITKVVDGDTVKVRAWGARRKRYTVRVIGIDTPEKYFGTECGSAGASRSMRQLAYRSGRGRRVRLTTDPSQDLFDTYGRLLAYVKTSSAQLNVAQVRRGWAKVYVYAGKRFRQYRRFARAQRQARRAERGVWEICGGNFHRRVRSRVPTSISPAHASRRYRNCGDLVKHGAGSYNVRAHKVRCRKARRIARQWENQCARQPDGSCWVRAGFYCRYRSAGWELGRIRCRRGQHIVKFVTGA